jgi:hypothetical protein
MIVGLASVRSLRTLDFILPSGVAFKRTVNTMKSPAPKVRPGLRFICLLFGSPIFFAAVISCFSTRVDWNFVFLCFTCGWMFLRAAWLGR